MTFFLRQLEEDYGDKSVEFGRGLSQCVHHLCTNRVVQRNLWLVHDHDSGHGWLGPYLGREMDTEVFVLDRRDSVVYQGRINDHLVFCPWQA